MVYAGLDAVKLPHDMQQQVTHYVTNDLPKNSYDTHLAWQCFVSFSISAINLSLAFPFPCCCDLFDFICDYVWL